jgi:hypothetical protein
VEEVHEVPKVLVQLEEVSVGVGDLLQGVVWFSCIVTPDTLQGEVHAVTDVAFPGLVHGLGLSPGLLLHFRPDGPDHRAADGVRRVEVAGLLVLVQRGDGVGQRMRSTESSKERA